MNKAVSGPLALRRLLPDDWALYRALRVEALTRHPDIFHSEPADWATMPEEGVRERLAHTVTVAAFLGDVPQGLATLALFARRGAKSAHKAEIWSVYIRPEARGRGVGRAILTALVEEARQRGYEALLLGCVTTNEPALALYRSLGFTIIGTERRRLKLGDGTYRDEHILELVL